MGIIEQTIKIISNCERGSEQYKSSVFILSVLITQDYKDQLSQLVLYGPLYDDTVISKQILNNLIKWNLAVRVHTEGNEDRTAATSIGYDVYRSARDINTILNSKI